jgi:hypothetical protein
LLAPQDAGVELVVSVRLPDTVSVIVAVAVQAFASVTVTVYVPAFRLFSVARVSAALVFHL